MSEEEIITDGIITTYQKYARESNSNIKGVIQITEAIKQYINDKDPKGFTRDRNCRSNIMEHIGQERMMDFITREYIKVALAKDSRKEPLSPLEIAVRKTFSKYLDKYQSVVPATRIVEGVIKDFVQSNYNHFTRDDNARTNVDTEYASQSALNELVRIVVESIVVRYKTYTVENLQVYPQTIEKCKEAIMSGKTLETEGDIILDDELSASSRIGLKRKGQEDAVLLVRHPNNSEFKMLIVADGVGGSEKGEYASNLAVSRMQEWFKSSDTLQYYQSDRGLEQELEETLDEISKEITKKHSGSATTIVAALVGKENTTIVNVGDSRAYIINGSEVEQVTEDQSLVYRMFQNGDIATKDNIRFHIDSNKILQCLGMKDRFDKFSPDFYSIDNKDYDMLMLVSDGVTDCLSDEQLMKISKWRPSNEIAKKVVEATLSKQNPDLQARRGIRNNPKYTDSIQPGKDNATIAVYTPKDKGER